MDPALGRFTTPDPVRDYVNPYSYVGHNPMNRIDPTGMAGFNPRYNSVTGWEFLNRGDPFGWLDVKSPQYQAYLAECAETAAWRREIKLIELIKKTIDAARNMAITGPEEHRARAGKIADALQEILDTHNYAISNSMSYPAMITEGKNGKPFLTVSSDALENPTDIAMGQLYHEGSHAATIRVHGFGPSYKENPQGWAQWAQRLELRGFMDQIYFYSENLDLGRVIGPFRDYDAAFDLTWPAEHVLRSYETNVYEAANHLMSIYPDDYNRPLFWLYGEGQGYWPNYPFEDILGRGYGIR